MMLAAATLFGDCVQNMPAANTGRPPDPNSVTTFNLFLTSDCFTSCTQGEPGMEQPMTVTVQNNTAVLVASGGMHYGLTRAAPYIHTAGSDIKIQANLSTAPKP